MAKETLEVDLKEEVESTQTTKSEETSEKKEETSQKTETTETKTEETQEKKEETKESTETTAEDEKFTLTDVQLNEKGEFVWKVNPDDPKSSVYIGSTLSELMKNVAKGITDKDTYIGKLKTEKLSADSVKGKHVASDEADEVANPNIDVDKIALDVAKEFSIKPEMFRYTDEEWRAREQEVGAVVASREANRVEQALAEANRRVSKANIEFINDRSLDLETAQVEEIVREMGLEDEFTPERYEEILTKVHDNNQNFRKNGLRKPGVIGKEVTKYLLANFREKIAKQVSSDKDDKLAADRLKKEKIRGVVSKTKAAPVLTEKAPKSITEAFEQSVREYASTH